MRDKVNYFKLCERLNTYNHGKKYSYNNEIQQKISFVKKILINEGYLHILMILQNNFHERKDGISISHMKILTNI